MRTDRQMDTSDFMFCPMLRYTLQRCLQTDGAQAYAAKVTQYWLGKHCLNFNNEDSGRQTVQI